MLQPDWAAVQLQYLRVSDASSARPPPQVQSAESGWHCQNSPYYSQPYRKCKTIHHKLSIMLIVCIGIK